MRNKLRATILLAGLIAVALFVLLIIGIYARSMTITAVASALGLLVIAILSYAGVQAYKALARILHSLSTRAKNLERRIGDHDLSGLDEPVESLPARIDSIGRSLKHTREQLLGVHRQVKVLRNRVPAGHLVHIEKHLDELQKDNQALLKTSFESALRLNRDPKSVITLDQARSLFRDYLEKGELLQLRPLIENFDVLREQPLSTLRHLYRSFRATGYWDLAAEVIECVEQVTGLDSDAYAAKKLKHEIRVYAQPTHVEVELPSDSGYDPTGPILHMVGRVLPETQTGYTLRTQYTAQAQARKGLPVAIVGQSGIVPGERDSVEHYEFRGIDYYLLPGPARNEVLLDEWLRINIEELAALVREIRPSVLHAHSDFFNVLIIESVGKRYGIPTVYESRGFWEYSWLSRNITANKWADSESLFSMYGLPSAYTYRKRAEELARQLPNHVFTLAEVMRDHILDSSDGSIRPESVSIVPNAVEVSNFPIQRTDTDLAAEIGLPKDALVVGYVSSMVEYEGIDTLIDAFQVASSRSSRTLCLLLVGGGDFLPQLQARAEDHKVQNVFFTGRVPHETVLQYYGLIDLFVVPRKKSTVSDLVTPLKPFEAFSTGRAVILSSVGALQEIADQSQAVEVFEAGNASDLAQRILELAENPERREQLSKRAASWVRNYRTWDRNVAEYYRVYRELGYMGTSSMILEAELKLHERTMNAGELLGKFALLETPPLTGWFSNSTMKQSAHEILHTGWKYEEFEPVAVASQPEWWAYGTRNRSWGFNLHTWKFLEPLLREHSTSGQIYWLEQAVHIALDWISTYRSSDAPEDPMVWYDMGLALRVPILLNLLVQTSKIDEMRDEATVLLEALVWHSEKLHEDEAFNPNNNHGFYTAASQLHLAKFASPLPSVSEIRAEGMERLEIMVERQFAADGVHLEHSPDYHRMLLTSFERAINDNLIDDDEIRKRIKKAAHVLGWMIQPDGKLVQLGDSPAAVMTVKNASSIDPETQFIMSRGETGVPPSQEMAVFNEGGYAFVRSPRPQKAEEIEEAGYLAFNAAFHSRAHKHADDLTVVWYDKGTEILVDAGRYGYGELLPADSPLRQKGYYYSSIERQYVESTLAHNTLMMDGADHERRMRKPYGSGLTECYAKDGVFDLSARARHSDFLHRRRLVYRPGESLLLKDSVFSQSPESRTATIWLNIDGGFELLEEGKLLVFEQQLEDDLLKLEIEGPGELIRPVRGQTSPLRGWRSRQDRTLEPVWSVGFSIPVETRITVETMLRIS